jgi:hypothetical protein
MLTYVVVIFDDYIYICFAFVAVDSKLYKMKGAYIKTLVRVTIRAVKP